MRKIGYFVLLSLMIAGFLVGCTTIPMKLHHDLAVKTSEIFIDRVEVFNGLKRDAFTGAVKELGTLVNIDRDPRYQKLVQCYLSALKRQLEDEGFVVTDSPKDKSLLLMTKIADDKPTKGLLGYTLYGQGTVVIQVNVCQNNEPLLTFGESANYSIFSIETQVRRLTPKIVQKLREKLL